MKKTFLKCFTTAISLASIAALGAATMPIDKKNSDRETQKTSGNTETALFAGGCFWCIEAAYEHIDGVLSATSGYTGGKEKPTYKEVASGTTQHAEAVQIVYDPAVVSYRELLDWFWRMHDPTTPNRQGADIGPQYRSAIFYHNQEQKEEAEASKRQLDAKQAFASPIVTEILPATTFFPAEDDHQDYFTNNPNAGYCRAVIAPKLKKLGLAQPD